MRQVNLVIIGSGPAGFSAAIYAARSDLKPILFEGFEMVSGGQLMETTEVENYAGFKEAILGPVLMENMRQQAMKFQTEIITEDVKDLDLSKRPFLVKGTKTVLQANAIIVATGAKAKRLDIDGADKFWQKGVTACAVCDGAAPIFRSKELFVIGGGDSAAEEALFLSRFAKKVYVVNRSEKLRASKIMIEKLLKNPKIEILFNSEIVKIEGDNLVRSVTFKNGETREAAGVFFAVGHKPNSDFLKGQLEINKEGYIITHNGTRTSIEGVFAAGDVQDPIYRQAITAAGSGCMAALDVQRWLLSEVSR